MQRKRYSCRREQLGEWCASAIAAVIDDLRDEFEERPAPIRYEIIASQVMWSEDGTGFKENGRKKERSFRDVKSYARAMLRKGAGSTLCQRIDEAIDDLSYQRPRPVLGGRTACEGFQQDRIELPDRQQFRKEVEQAEQRWLDRARSRSERDSARRRASEEVLLRYRFLEISGDVSRDCEAETATD